MLWLAMIVLPACGSDPALVGAIASTDARLSVATSGDRLVAYVCGGPQTLETHTRWFEGRAEEDGTFSLSKDEWVLAGTLSEGTASGTLQGPQGAALGWTAQDEGGSTGLFGGEGSGACRTGVIVFSADPAQIQGAGCDAAGRLQQVTPDGPITAGGFSVMADGRRLFVEPVTP